MDLLKGVPEQVVANCDHIARFIKIAQCEVKMVAAIAVAAKYAITQAMLATVNFVPADRRN